MDVAGAWPLNIVGPIVEAAHAKRKPVAFVGIGTESLTRQQSKRIVSEVLAPTVVHWSVRSERDKDRLVECNVPADKITAAADLAWMLDPVTTEYGEARLRELGVDPREPIVGVNINHEPHMTERAPRLFDDLAAVLDQIVEERRVRVVFLCNEVRDEEKFDKAASEKVLRAMKNREWAVLVPNEYRSPQQMLSLIACCRMTITSRYHFSLFSAVQKVPFLALKRSDKIDDLCWDLRWDYGVALGHLGDLSLAEMLSEMETKRASLVARLEENARKMRQRTLKNRVAIAALAKETAK